MLLFPELQREHAQIISTFTLGIGVMLMAMGDTTAGLAAIGVACWIMVMNDSILLVRVQNEMRIAFEDLRKKQEAEIQDLLYFLRESKALAQPLACTESAKKFVRVIQFPAFVMSPTLGIVSANERFTNLLGYRPREIDGWPSARINNKVVMSEVGQLVSQEPYHNMKAMWMRYVYVHKDGSHVKGSLDINKLDDGGYFVVFHADSEAVISNKQLLELLI